MNVCPADVLTRALEGIGISTHGAAQVGIRPEHLWLVSPSEGIVSGRAQVREYTGGSALLYVEVEGSEPFLVQSTGDDQAQPGDEVHLSLAATDLHVFDADGCVLRSEREPELA